MADSKAAVSGGSKASLTHWRKFWSPRQWKENSVAVITGASSGIGRELALQYAKRKCRLVLAARSQKELEAVAVQCRAAGSVTRVVVTDVTVESQCTALMAAAVSAFGTIDIVVLNAGIGCHHTFEDTKDLNVFRQLMDVNFFGYLNCTKAAFPYLKAAQPRGQIVVVSSMSGEMGLPFRTAYCASKFAVTGFFEALRSELECDDKRNPNPIHITIVCPPSVATGLRAHSLTVKGGSPIADTPDAKAISAQHCASVVIEAADRRLRKVYFPLTAYLGVYVRPFFPDVVDFYARKRSKL